MEHGQEDTAGQSQISKFSLDHEALVAAEPPAADAAAEE